MKKVISICLLLTIMMCFVGCHVTNSKNSKNANANSANALANSTIKLGSIISLEGLYKEYGKEMLQGIQLAAEEINSEGGINGIKIEIVFENDFSDVKNIAQCCNSLLSQDVKVILGAQVTQLFEESRKSVPKQMLMVNIVSSTMNTKNTIDVTMPYDGAERADIFAHYIASNNMAKKVVSISYDSRENSQFQETLCAKLQEEGIETICLNYDYNDSFLETDIVDCINSSRADLVFINGSAYKAITEIKKIGYKGIIMTDYLDEYGEAEFFDYDLKNLQGTLTLDQFAKHDNSPNASKFINAFEKRYNDSPDLWAAQAYSSVYVIKNAMEKAGIQSGDITYEELCKKIIDILPYTEYDGPLGKLTWDASGKLLPEVKCFKFDGEKYVLNTEQHEKGLSGKCDMLLCSGYSGSDFYELVANRIDAYPDSEYQVGVVKNNEWLVKLSPNSPFLDSDGWWKGIDKSYQSNAVSTDDFHYIGQGVFLYKNSIIYKPETNTYFENLCNRDYTQLKNITEFVGFESIHEQGTANNYVYFKLFNIQTGEAHEMKGYFENVFCPKELHDISDGLFYAAERSWSNYEGFFDTEGNLILDLKDYKITDYHDYMYKNGSYTITCKNNNGVLFNITFDTKGDIIKQEKVD